MIGTIISLVNAARVFNKKNAACITLILGLSLVASVYYNIQGAFKVSALSNEVALGKQLISERDKHILGLNLKLSAIQTRIADQNEQLNRKQEELLKLSTQLSAEERRVDELKEKWSSKHFNTQSSCEKKIDLAKKNARDIQKRIEEKRKTRATGK